MVGAPIDLFATATEPIYLAMATDRLYRDFCRVIGRPDLVDDERFATPAGRSRNRDALKVEIEAALTTRPAAEWLAEMRHLPAGGVRTIDHALQAPEVLDREMVRYVVEDDHQLALLGTPFKFADSDLAGVPIATAARPAHRRGPHHGAGDEPDRHRAAPPRRRHPLMATVGAARHAALGSDGRVSARLSRPVGGRRSPSSPGRRSAARRGGADRA